MSSLRELVRRFGQYPHRFAVLLGVLFVLLFISPAISYVPGSRILFPILAALIPLGAVYAVSDSPRHMRIALALGLPAAVGSFLELAEFGLPEHWFVLLFPPVFYGYAAAIVGRKVFRSDTVTPDTLSGAAVVYLLIGITWWFFFLLVETLEPGAIGGRVPGLQTPEDRFEILYFSFVTLTTLGYGDLLPTTRPAQTLAVVEAITGVLYLSIVIARLVGVYAAQALSRRSD